MSNLFVSNNVKSVLTQLFDAEKNKDKIINAHISLLGSITLKFIDYVKGALWNVLLLVSGFIFYDPIKNPQEISNLILLYCILEETSKNSGEPIDIFFNIPMKLMNKGTEYKNVILTQMRYKYNKEHESIVKLFKHLDGMNKSQPSHFINSNLIQNVKSLYGSVQDKLSKSSFLKSEYFQNVIVEILKKNELLNFIKHEENMNEFDKAVLYSRFLHVSKAVLQKDNTTFYLFPLNTLLPFQGEFRDKSKKTGLDKLICVYESGMININENDVPAVKNRKVANLKLLTTFNGSHLRKFLKI
jgi:hypothetical protein